VTVAKKPGHREEHEGTVKTIAQGMPVDAVYPWLLTPVLFSAQAAMGASRIRIPCALFVFRGWFA